MRSSILIHFILTLSTIISLDGCKENATSPETNVTQNILPLAIGNVWIYQVDIYVDSTGNVDDHPVSTQFDTMQVVRDSVIGNERWFAISYSTQGKTYFTGQNFYTNRVDGIYVLRLQQQVGSYHNPYIELYLKYPVMV